jgi:Rad51
MVNPTLSQQLFPLNIRGVKDIFPGFALGDFAVLEGASSLSLASLLCVKAQLPIQLGGLQSSVVFIDGGNTFRLYQIAQITQIHQLDPNKVLDNIYISRAFTAYQMVTLIEDHLKEAIEKYKAKLVIVSDLAGFFLDKDIPDFETQRIFSQVTNFLSNFARVNKIIVIATSPPHIETKRNNLLHDLTYAKAGIVMSLKKTNHSRQFFLEKHPYLNTGYTELPSENLKLTDFY